MFDKILAKLKEQRGDTSNVSDRTLEDLARSLESVITTDEILEAADLTKAIESFDGNLNHYSAEAVKKAEQKKKNDEDKKKKKKVVTVSKNDDDEVDDDEDKNDVPSWAKKLIENQQAIVDDLNGMKQEKTTSSRKTRLIKSLEKTPDFYKKPILKGFEKINFEDEDSFDQYLKSVESSRDEFTQAAAEKGISIAPTPSPKKEEDTGETDVLKEANQVVQKAKETLKKNE